MPKYVALLRGINVGGNTKVEMPRLKSVFEKLGAAGVATYINSGNVIFSDSRVTKALEPLIEKALAKEFGLKLRIVLRSAENIAKLCKEIPSAWTNDSVQKTDVLFLWKEIDSPDIIKKVKINPKIENARYINGALVWNTRRENVTRGGGVKLIKSEHYAHMTARNINTVRKLNQLLQA